MIGGIATFFAGLFSTSKMQDVAIDGLRKLGGLDEMTQREKADYLLSYVAATKHQSPIRRLIALSLTVLYVSVIIAWLISAGVGYYLSSTVSLEFAGAVKMFMGDVVVQPFNIILAFYFITNIASRLGK